jgi:hypothetical protein
VIADIEQHKTEGKRWVNWHEVQRWIQDANCYPNNIVFSCWTRSLDLIGIFLKSRDIAFVRIDGSHSLSQRKWILENYQKDPEIKILLMTTGTGAIGSVSESLETSHSWLSYTQTESDSSKSCIHPGTTVEPNGWSSGNCASQPFRPEEKGEGCAIYYERNGRRGKISPRDRM